MTRLTIPLRTREYFEAGGWTMWDGLGSQIPHRTGRQTVDVLLRNGHICNGPPEGFWWGRLGVNNGEEVTLRREQIDQPHRYTRGREIVAWRSGDKHGLFNYPADQLSTPAQAVHTALI